MESLSKDFKALLEDEATFDPSNEFFLSTGKEPGSPVNTITIYNTGGAPPMLLLSGNPNYEYPSVQIRARSDSDSKAWAILNSIKELFHGRANFEWNGAFYTLFEALSDPQFLSQDANQRFYYVLNFSVQRKKV